MGGGGKPDEVFNPVADFLGTMVFVRHQGIDPDGIEQPGPDTPV